MSQTALRYVALKLLPVVVVSIALLLTYDRCIPCVLGVAIFSAVTINCLPFMPVIFLLSVGVLLMHAIDYDKATIKVEVPLQELVYVPTWKEVQQYVHVLPQPKDDAAHI